MRVRAALLAVLVLALFPAAASADYPHVVAPGETLTSVAAVDGLSIPAIATANGISDQAQLVAGQILLIPPRSLATASAGTAAVVAQDETDPDSDSDTESVTRSATTQVKTTTVAHSPTTSTTEAVSAVPRNTASAVPTVERVSAGQIAYIAEANGVPAALAEAIGWQESGWNNDETSGVGAVGVMQIVPTTWNWIDRYLTPSQPLGTASAAENIRAGVLLLHSLLQLTGGDEPLAVAGYFQGIASVKARGMYAATRQYVADVMALTQRFGG